MTNSATPSPGSQLDFSPHEDLHTVASLLKLYLRELPEPLVPFVYYDSFRRAIQCKEYFRWFYTYADFNLYP